MRKLTKCLALTAAAATVMTGAAMADDAQGSVYYLQFKPEASEQWVALAEKYTEETGVEVNVVTAASGTYESTLKAEMAKDEMPTLFHVNGPVGLATWKDYCASDRHRYLQRTEEPGFRSDRRRRRSAWCSVCR